VRIAQVAPLAESVPPKAYGGTERVVSVLTEQLVALGHDVTLFASGDSVTSARLVPVCEAALRLNGRCIDPLAHSVRLVEAVVQRANEFDVIHFHIDYVHFPVMRRLATPHVTTVHGRLDLPDLAPLYREFCDAPLVSISNAQRQPLPFANWQATVYHGLPEGLYRFRDQPRRYLIFMGRASPEKGLDRAIQIAQSADLTLKIVAKVDAADRVYFDERIKPLLGDPRIEFLGERGEAEKETLLSGAQAMLFPIDWPEPFGLVMIEAMACGVPVIAFRRGSVPEVIDDGVTGFIVDSVEEAVAKARPAAGLDRARCRRVFEERFSARRMAGDYLSVYARLAVGGSRDAPRRTPSPLIVQSAA
jgi:glycosyltransferase involved in cell wall biosynthesis